MAKARDSLSALFSDTASVQDSVFGKLDIAPADTGGLDGKPEMKLEYPMNLGSNDVNHFVVFHIWGDIVSNLDSESQGVVEDAQSYVNKWKTWGAVTTGTAVGTTRVAPRIINWLKGTGRFFSGIKGGKVILTVLGIGGGAAIGGTVAGRLSHGLGLTTKETEHLKTYNTHKKETYKGVFADEEDRHDEQGRFTRFGKARSRMSDTIALYMPQKIQSLSVLEYEQQDLSFMQGVTKDLDGYLAALGITKLSGALDSVSAVLGGNTNTQAALQASMRISQNPRKQLNFREPVSRKFELNFNFSPKNEMESVRAYQIIQTFKKHAYPKLNRMVGKGSWYTFPAEFEIEYYTMQNGEPVENNWLNKIGRCALREINVDYASSGSYSTFDNGAPTNMMLSLTFEEMRLLDSELIESEGM